jgi:transcriptional regulator with XRE-family HTH domain
MSSKRQLSAFGQHLRYWRTQARLSQIELAAEARTTPRYVSFIESGRSRPGRDMVLRLASALDVPLRERNVMLASAGLPPAFPALDLDDAAMKPLRHVLDRVLRGHEPYPAWIVGRGLHFVSSNRAAERLFPGLCSMPAEQIIDLWYGLGPFRELVENWQDVAWAGIASLRREASRGSDKVMLALLRRAEAHVRDLPPPEASAHFDLPVICPRLKAGGRTVRTISTVMRFDTAAEVTTSELRVELMFPADAESEVFFAEAGARS